MAGDIVYDGRSLPRLPADELRRIRGEEIAIILQDAQAALTPTLKVGEQVGEL